MDDFHSRLFQISTCLKEGINSPLKIRPNFFQFLHNLNITNMNETMKSLYASDLKELNTISNKLNILKISYSEDSAVRKQIIRAMSELDVAALALAAKIS